MYFMLNALLFLDVLVLTYVRFSADVVATPTGHLGAWIPSIAPTLHHGQRTACAPANSSLNMFEAKERKHGTNGQQCFVYLTVFLFFLRFSTL